MENKTYEVALKRLDEILILLNDTDLPLAQTTALYKEGLSLYQQLNEMLDRVEGETALLNPNPDGNFQQEPFSFQTDGVQG